MKTLIYLFCIALLTSLTAGSAQAQQKFYDFKTTTIDSKPFGLDQLKGKKVLVVNTASKCGHTPQYADLEKLYEQYKNQNFVIIGFPANNFLKQEPGTNQEIEEFCTKNYGVTFPMMSKISVKGSDMDPIYHWLTEKAQNGVADAEVKWNFQKFMIDEKGNWVGSVAPGDSPMCDKILNWLKAK